MANIRRKCELCGKTVSAYKETPLGKLYACKRHEKDIDEEKSEVETSKCLDCGRWRSYPYEKKGFTVLLCSCDRDVVEYLKKRKGSYVNATDLEI